MDRYSGLEQMSEAEAYALALLFERRQWAADPAARAEYDAWHAAKANAEAGEGSQ